MDKVEEARENIHAHCDGCIVYADAYALAAHVERCKERKPRSREAIRKDLDELGEMWPAEYGPACGDGWYCDGAKRYMKEAARCG